MVSEQDANCLRRVVNEIAEIREEGMEAKLGTVTTHMGMRLPMCWQKTLRRESPWMTTRSKCRGGEV